MNINTLKRRPIVIREELLYHYHSLGLNEHDLIILLKLLHVNEVTRLYPAIDDLKQGTTLSHQDITTIIKKLIQLDLLSLSVDKNQEGKLTEYMHLDGFYTQLSTLIDAIEAEDVYVDQAEQFKLLFRNFEQSFGRTLSPLEIDTLNQWIDVDKHSYALIQAALNEAMSNNKASFKYIDRILLNWKKNNVQTIDDSKKISEKFHQPQMTHTVKKIKKFDWLNGENQNDK